MRMVLTARDVGHHLCQGRALHRMPLQGPFIHRAGTAAVPLQCPAMGTDASGCTPGRLARRPQSTAPCPNHRAWHRAECSSAPACAR